MQSILAIIDAHGGAVGLVVAYNVIITALKNVCDALKIQEPSAVQKAAAVISAILGALSANTAPKPADPKPPVA